MTNSSEEIRGIIVDFKNFLKISLESTAGKWRGKKDIKR